MARPPYLAMELDAMEKAEAAARSLNQPPQLIIGGLMLMWRWCRRQRTDIIDRAHVQGFFQGDVGLVLNTLQVWGFIEEHPALGWRVLGAKEWLAIQTSMIELGRQGGRRSAATGKSQANLKRGPKRIPKRTPEPEPEAVPEPIPEDQLAASSQQLTATKEDLSGKKPPDPPPPRKRSEAQRFFDWAEDNRTEVTGNVRGPEPDAVALNAWFRRALAECNLPRLERAFAAYLLQPRDDYWVTRGFPFQGFMSDNVWRQYVPPEGAG